MPNPAVVSVGGKFGGPYDIGLQLLDNATVPTTEGLWLPSRFAKIGSIEVAGSMSTLSIQLVGTNQLSEPLNQMTLTIGGTITAGDVVTVKAANGNISGGSASVAYTVLSSDTTSTIAAALAALMASSLGMQMVQIGAQAAAAVITAQFPTEYIGSGITASYGQTSGAVATSNATVFSATVSGSATETVTIAGTTTVGQSIGSAITALGLTAVTPLPRWIRARMTTLTGTNAFINATFCGAA